MLSSSKTIIVGFLILINHVSLVSQSIDFNSSGVAEELENNMTFVNADLNSNLISDDIVLNITEASKPEAHTSDALIPSGNTSTRSDFLDNFDTNPLIIPFNSELREFLPLFRVNAGGPALTYNGELFSADANFIGGKTFENTSATVSSLFQTERSASPPTFEYAFSVPNGEYEVILHFAEIYFGATGGGSGGVGSRIFDVDGEGIKLLDNYDIYADVGPQTEVSKTFLVTVTDGELNLIFDATIDGVDQPKVSAIEVLDAVQYPLIVIDPIPNQNNEVDDVITTLGVTASGGNPSADFTFAISGEPDGISIDPTSGLISGTIESTAVIGGFGQNGVHDVIITVGKPGSFPVNVNFNWIITGPQLPFTMDGIVDQQDTVGSTVSLLVNSTGGDITQPIIFSISGQPLGLGINATTGEINGTIDANALTGGANNDGIHQVTVTANRQGSSSVQEQFIWTVTNPTCAWNDLADANISRYQSRNELVGDKIYVMGGWLQGINSSNDLDIYDITNDTWSIGADLLLNTTHMGSVVVGDEIWLIGGFDGNIVNSPDLLTEKVQIYNTVTNSWRYGPDLPKAIGSGSATVNNNRIHFIGGLDEDIQTDIADHYILDLDDISAGWSTAAPMPRPRNHHSTESINGIVYTIGGQEGHQNSTNGIAYMESYDPNTDSWTILADLPVTRSHFESGSLVHNDKIIIVGGKEETTNFSNDVTEYDPSTNTWTDSCSLPYNLMSPMAQVYQDKLIVSGGGINGTSNLINTTQWLQLSPSTDITVNKLAHQVNQTGDDIGSIQVVASGGNPTFDFSYSISGQPNGITIDSGSGEISGIVDAVALSGGPNSNGLHFVTVTVSKSGSNDNQLTFSWNITDLVWQAKGEVENYSIRHECSFVQVGDKFALIGGRESSDVDIFDYNLGAWNPAVSTSPNVLNHFQGVYYQGYIWAIGAFVGGNSVFPNDPIADNIWLFDPTSNQWIQGPEIPEARKRGASGAVMYNDKFYVIGGNTLGHSGGFVPWFDEYDPKTGIWTSLIDAPHARDHFQATLVGDKIYVIGGAQTDQPSSNYVAEVDIYNFATGSWSTMFNNDLPTPRDGASIAVFNNDIIVIGGGDKDETINGVFVKGTREITEAFDTETETWYKMPDMNFGHRSTQAIVSGNGIHILAGQSSNGNIHGNMEYYGEDNPTGNPIVVSQLSVPNLISIANEGNSSFDIEVLNGETGVFVTSMEITGVDASDFSISSGEITNGLLRSGSSHTLNISLSGVGDNRVASLNINYGNGQTAVVNLTNSPLTNPGDQSSFIGDIVSLQIEVIANGSVYSFTASDLPEGLVIDESTGLISGTVTGAILNSPYTSRVAIIDTSTLLEVSFVNFQWEVIDPTIITLEDIPNQSNFVGDTVLFSASAVGGDDTFPLIYAISGEPLGVAIDGATGEISGTIDLLAGVGGPNNDGVYEVTVTASRQGALDTITNFTWTITDTPSALFRINAGGPELTYNGDLFSADANFIGGKTFENTSATVAPLFQTERSASPPTFEYAFSVPNGDYEVILHFAEIFFGATGGGSGGTGNRVFDVESEGTKLLNDYDIFADVGAQTEVSKTFLVTVTDGELNLLFDAEGSDGVNQPKVAAIEILSFSEYPGISVDNVVDQNNVAGDQIQSIDIVASGGNPSADFTYAISGEPDGVFIDATTGLISGTISQAALNGGPDNNGIHEVIVTVSKPASVDAQEQFIWTITNISCTWNGLADSSLEKMEAQSAKVGDKLYVFSGFLSGLIISNATEIYDTVNDIWTTGAPIPTPVTHAGIAVVGTDIWIVAGFAENNPGVAIDEVQIYDTVANSWSSGPSLPAARGSGAAALNNGKIHYFGGLLPDRVTDVGEHYTLDINDQTSGWIPVATLPNPRNHHSAASINGLVYAIGGQFGHDNGVSDQNFLDVYDPLTNVWTSLTGLPTARSHFEPGTIVHNNKIIIVGGRQGDFFFDDITEYDPITNVWTERCKLPEKLLAPAAKVFGDRLIVANGGINGISNPTSATRWIAIEPSLEFPPLLLNPVADQFNQIGEASSLILSASGGDPSEDTTYTINNQPAGLNVDASNGQIIGNINALALNGGPNNNGIHRVTVTATKPGSVDAIREFNWYIGLIYDGTSWLPYAPDETTVLDNALIMSGEYTVNSDTEVHNLNVLSGASLIIEAGNAMTTNGDINIDGNGFIELRSTSTSYSSLIPKANGTVVGNVIYKRHVNNNVVDATGSNDLIAAPLSGQPFVDFLSNNPNIVSNSSNTLYLFGPFNKTNGAYDVYGASETATLDAGIGYRAASTDTGTFTFTGIVNTGPVPITISNSGPAFQEWNLIGNPYPSYLDTGAFLTTNISVFDTNSAAIYGYDGDASDGWTVWNLNTDALIAPGQGFFVASEALEGTVNFLPSMREKGLSDDFIDGRSASSLPGFLKLSLIQNDKTYHTDFYFNPNASRGLDKGYDAQVWGGNASGFSLHSYLVEDNTGLPMAIQSLGETDYADVLIPLGINANLGEQIRIGISEHSLPATVEVYLEDRLNQTVALLNTGDYVLTPSSSLDNGRFFLRFNDSSLSSQNPTFDTLQVFSDSDNQSIVISGLINEPSRAKLFDVQGREVISSALRLNTTAQTINVDGLEKGVYIISIASASEKMTQKLIIR